MEFPQKIAVAPPSKMSQWWWDVKKIEIYFRASAETNTFSVHNANIKGKMIGDVKFEFSTCIFVLLTAVIGLEIGLMIGFYDRVFIFLPRSKPDRGTGQKTDNPRPVRGEKIELKNPPDFEILPRFSSGRVIKRMVRRLHRKFSIGPWPQFF